MVGYSHTVTPECVSMPGGVRVCLRAGSIVCTHMHAYYYDTGRKPTLPDSGSDTEVVRTGTQVSSFKRFYNSLLSTAGFEHQSCCLEV